MDYLSMSYGAFFETLMNIEVSTRFATSLRLYRTKDLFIKAIIVIIYICCLNLQVDISEEMLYIFDVSCKL